MEYERVMESCGQISIWVFRWDMSIRPPKKVDRTRLGFESPLRPFGAVNELGEAVSWAYGRTLGNIATGDANTLKLLPGKAGKDEVLPCEIIAAGKFRNGRERWWCRTHQKHWGTVADVRDAQAVGVMRCAHWSQPMDFVLNPREVDLDLCAEVGIWCSLPPALTSSGNVVRRRPKVHVHVRDLPGGAKRIDQDFDAVCLKFSRTVDLFADGINRVHVTPPAAFDFLLANERGCQVECFDCHDCGAPHLDLGEFAIHPHVKHLCGNCGRDGTWTHTALTSSPLAQLNRNFDKGSGFVDVCKELNIDDYPGSPFAVWASTPAIVWSADRPQERGIHVHLSVGGERVIDDTFGSVIYRGYRLRRDDLLRQMLQNTDLA